MLNLRQFIRTTLVKNTITIVSRLRCSDADMCQRAPHLSPFALFLLISFTILLTPALLLAAQVTLAWDANDPTPEGYCLYQRTDNSTYDYSQPTWTGSGTTCTVADLVEDTQYYFVVRAYDSGSESGDSNEVAYYAASANPVPVNNSPQANAGTDQTVEAWTMVTLDGTGSSDPDEDQLNYAWVQTGGPTVEIFSPSTAQPTFTAPGSASSDTALTFRLTVTDPDGLSASDTCRVTVPATTPANDPPVADAGDNQSVYSGTRVTLDGSHSSDPEGQTLTCQWVQTGGPMVQISSSTATSAYFTAPEVEIGQQATLIFELTVFDSSMLSCTDTCIVQVQPTPPTDSDGDGTPDEQDAFPDDASEWIDTDLDGTGNNADADDDNDNMPDAWETAYGFDPLVDDADQDSDGDGLSNLEEYQNGSDPMNAEENLAPRQPSILSPVDAADEVSLRTKIIAAAFSDPNGEDTHEKSEWRIAKASDQRGVMQVTRYRSLTTLRVPYFVLNPGTSYTCQVRYYDQHGLASEWSPTITFTTTASSYWWGWRGVIEGQEAPESTDLNSNGVTDLAESQTIRSVSAVDDSHTMAVSIETSPNVEQIDGAGAIDPYSEEELPPVEDINPYGMIGYRIQLLQPGQSTSVSLYFSGGVDNQTAWMALNSEGDYADCGDQVAIQADGSVVRWLTDGGENDLDGVANGIVVDMIGPRDAAAQGDGDLGLDNGTEASEPSSGGGGCFIGSLIK